MTGPNGVELPSGQVCSDYYWHPWRSLSFLTQARRSTGSRPWGSVPSHGWLGIWSERPDRVLPTLSSLFQRPRSSRSRCSGQFVSGRLTGRRRALSQLPLVSWLVVPIAAAAVISLVVQPLFIPRYFIVVLPAFILLVASGITAFRARAGAVPIATAIVIAVGVSAVWSLYDDTGRQDWRRSIATVTGDWQQGDAIVLDPAYYLPAVDHYTARQMPAASQPVPVDGDDAQRVIDDRTDIVIYRAVSYQEVNADRIWFITTPSRIGTPREPDTDDLAGFDLLPDWSAEQSWEFEGLAVKLLVPVGLHEAET